MTSGEFSLGTKYAGTEEVEVALQVTTIDLGEGNEGRIGPDALDAETRAAITEANRDPQYQKAPTNRWKCVDGRCSQDEVDALAVESEEADPQIAGGLAICETAVEFMIKPQPHSLRETVVAKTREAIDDGQVVVVHGANGDKNGCAANADLQPTLRYNAANADVVVPKTLQVVGALELGHLIASEDLTGLINQGAEAAANDALWNATAAEVADAIVGAGGIYQDLQGAHGEGSIRAMTENTAFAKAKYVRNMSTPELTIQEFAASFGAYKALAFERGAKHGRSERETALQVAAALLFNVGLCKHLSTKEMTVDVVA